MYTLWSYKKKRFPHGNKGEIKMNLFEEYKNILFKKDCPESSILVPLLIWTSNNPMNIDACQRVNKKFFKGNSDVMIHELYLGLKSGKITKYPKATKKNIKLDMFYEDLGRYLQWTPREVKLNIKSGAINPAEYVDLIADAYGYDKKERRVLKNVPN